MSVSLKIIIFLLVLIVLFPVIVTVITSIPATKVIIEMEDVAPADLTLKITGHQWRWHYEYVGSDIDFFSVTNDSYSEIGILSLEGGAQTMGSDLIENYNLLLVPSGRRVRVLITSSDVIHSWWVPAFGVKKDAIPGYVNELWFKVEEGHEGFYYGQCAKICGNGHPYMQVGVKVVDGDEFEAWLTAGGSLTELHWTPPALHTDKIIEPGPQ